MIEDETITGIKDLVAMIIERDKRIAEIEADLRTSINLREQTDMQLARTQNLLGKKVAELADTVTECLAAKSNEDIMRKQLAALLEAAQEAVEAERLNRSSTRNYRGLFETKKRPRHHRFENAIDKLAAMIQEKGE